MDVVDKYLLVPEILQRRGLANQHIKSFDFFTNHGIKKIVLASRNERIVSSLDPRIYIKFLDVKINKPDESPDESLEGLHAKVNKTEKEALYELKEKRTIKHVYPHFCRLTGITYATAVKVDIEYTERDSNTKNIVTKIKKDHVLCYIPVMLRSCCCRLRDLCEEELARLGECPLDPGGYFVIKGTEKVLMIQEQLSENRIIIDTDEKGCVSASFIGSKDMWKNKTRIVMKNEKIYLQLNQFTKLIPIMVIMKAMGMESDQEVVQMVDRDPRYSGLLLPSIEECASERIYTRHQALEFLEKNVVKSRFTNEKISPMTILDDILLAHVPVHQGDFYPKCIFVVLMLRRLLEAILNGDTIDDKDYLGNKRLELSGQMISLLFEDLFITMSSQAKHLMDKALMDAKRCSPWNISHHLKEDWITHGLELAIATGNWHIKRFQMNRVGVTQTVCRQSFIAALGQMTRIQRLFQRSRKMIEPRLLQPSQWGMLCPCDTTTDESCGLVKHLALVADVTTEVEDAPLISLCHSFGVEDICMLPGQELHSANSYLVIFNSLILGKHRQPQRFANDMRKLRRAGKIGEFVSVFVNEKQRCVYLAADGGRVCRPLVIADEGVSRIKEHHMKDLRDGARVFDDFLREGLVEYLDVNEENNALIALYEGEADSKTTHIEIEPFTILGVCAGLIPFLNHNQGPRNTYQCAMGKQAMGNIAYNQLCRMDTLQYLLVYPQRPLVTTKSIELVGYDKLGAGQNATVAIMSYSGYDIEDAIVMNKSSLDRGFGRSIVMKKVSAVKQAYDRIIMPQMPSGKGDLDSHMQILDTDGIASPGEIVRPRDILINKQSATVSKEQLIARTVLPDSAYTFTPVKHKGTEGETTVVDRVALFTDKDRNMCINLIICDTRRPEVGDKFSSRHGQKGVCGTIVQQEDLPFSESGICPDIIMNPHGFPSRMTIGQLLELLGGKEGASCGRFHYGSAFRKKKPGGHDDRVEVIGETLVRHGLCYSGKDFLYSGITGCPLQAYIFMGPIYYQRLKHMVVDKMQARARGPRLMLTRQPTAGRNQDGGLRLGEMERDCLIAYGASLVISERLMISSDLYNALVCRKCGLFGYYHHELKTRFCSTCKSGENVAMLKLPYAAKLLFQELQAMNIVARLNLTDD